MTKDTAPRRRDAAASRERLLRAAGELFGERGFDRTTARDIGERAGVDPAMIARYFGGKAQLYIAVLRADDPTDTLTDLRDPDRLARLVERFERQGAGPIMQCAVHPYDDADAQAAAVDELRSRLVAPLRERLEQDGDEQADLRAEVLIAAFVGIVLGRRSGAFQHLANADVPELLAMLREVLGS